MDDPVSMGIRQGGILMTDNDVRTHEVGQPGDFSTFPASVTLEGAPYWLVQEDTGGYRLFSALCPHAGGDVRPHGDQFFCPLHWWTFSQKDGSCTSMDDERLMERRVELREDGRLYAVGPDY
jgi:nitrite reductase/ring-hydroxylating ferredoxin subunit